MTSQRAHFALKGHSGAGLTLIEGAQPIVRKQATRLEQNARLKDQCAKLQEAHKQGLSCPEIYKTGELEGLFFFDMEFIPGETLAHAIISGRQLDWSRLLPQIRRQIDHFAASETGIIAVESFLLKIRNILAACGANMVAAPYIARLGDQFERLAALDWTSIPSSECHGDLTLENILIRSDGQLVFLDFDVPEQSSWQLDIGKMYQDLFGHWCLRSLALEQVETFRMINAQMALARADAALAPITDLVPGGRARFAQLAAFHLARTLPYARDENIVRFVSQRLGHILAIAREGT